MVENCWLNQYIVSPMLLMVQKTDTNRRNKYQFFAIKDMAETTIQKGAITTTSPQTKAPMKTKGSVKPKEFLLWTVMLTPLKKIKRLNKAKTMINICCQSIMCRL